MGLNIRRAGVVAAFALPILLAGPSVALAQATGEAEIDTDLDNKNKTSQFAVSKGKGDVQQYNRTDQENIGYVDADLFQTVLELVP